MLKSRRSSLIFFNVFSYVFMEEREERSPGENQAEHCVVDKYDCIRKEKPAERYTRITFAASC